MTGKDLFPDESSGKYSRMFDLGDDQAETASTESSRETSSLRLLQRWGLGCSISIVVLLIAVLVFQFFGTLVLGGTLFVIKEVAGGPATETPGYWEAFGAGLFLGIALLAIIVVWRFARRGIEGALSTFSRPPIWKFIGFGVAMLGIIAMLFGESRDIPLFLDGTAFGYWVFTVLVALPWAVHLSRKAWQLSYDWAAREPYRAGVITAVIFVLSIQVSMGMLVGVIILDEINDLDADQVTEGEAPEREARYMSIFSVGETNWTEDDEEIARRRDHCFESLADTSSQIFKQGRWKAYAYLRTESRAEDAVFNAILKACEAHGDDEKDNIESYFHVVLENHLIDLEERRERAANLCHIDLDDMHSIQPPGQGERAEQRQYLAAVQQAFCGLSSDQQTALKASALGHSHREIATMLDTSIPNARQLVSRGRRNVRANLHN